MSGASEYSNYESNDQTHVVDISMRALDEYAKQAGGIVTLVQDYAQELIRAFPKGFDKIGSIAYRFANGRRHMDDDASYRLVAQAFLKGAVAGLLVARESYDTRLNLEDVFATIDLEQLISVDGQTHPSEVAIALQERAMAVVAALSFDGAILEKWEMACVENIELHPLYRHGFGLLLGSANWVIEQQNTVDLMQMEMEAASSTSQDWDAALTALLDNDQ